jgi:restriction endonuclease S subunit
MLRTMSDKEPTYEQLGALAEIQTAVVFRDQMPRAHAGGNVRALVIRDVVSNAPVDWRALPCITVDAKHQLRCLQPGDVVIPSRGDHYKARLYEGPAREVFPMGHLTTIRPGPTLLPAYLTWFLNLGRTQAGIPNLLTGSNIKALTKAALSELQIELPDLACQAQIATLYATTERLAQVRLRLNQLDLLEMTHVTQQLLQQAVAHA